MDPHMSYYCYIVEVVCSDISPMNKESDLVGLEDNLSHGQQYGQQKR